MPSKLTWHFQGIPGWAADVVATSGVEFVKVIDPPEQNPFPGILTIGRTFMPDNESNALAWSGALGAEQWFNRWLPTYESRTYIHAWEGPNEPHPMYNATFRDALRAFTIRWAELMHARGWRVVGFNWSVGWPDDGHAASFGPAMEHLDYLGLHEYSAPSMWDGEGWYCLRYRKTIGELEAAGFQVPPIIIGECGIDGGVLSPPRPKTGWKSYASEDQYLDNLKWYDDEIQQDNIAAATIFTAGPNLDWIDFDVDRSLSERLADYIASSPPTPPPKYSLAVGIQGTGTGSVRRNPPTGPYPVGTAVILTAEPQEDSEFTGWAGDLTGTTNPATITMNSDKQVTATFDAEGPPLPPDQQAKGVDVSYWQGANVDWQAAAADSISFAYIRASVRLEADARYTGNHTEAGRAGILRGAYHYLSGTDSPVEQAQLFAGMAAGDAELPPMVGVLSQGLSEPIVRAFIEEFEAQTGITCGIYTRKGLFDPLMGNPDWASERLLWAAHWTTSDEPLLPKAWDQWEFWQHDGSGQVAGFSGNVALDRFRGSVAQLEAKYGGNGAQPPDGVKYIDDQGNPITWQRFHAIFGNVSIEPAASGDDDFPNLSAFRATELYDSGLNAPPSVLVTVRIDGQPPPVGQFSIGWHWPDAPQLPGTDIRAILIPLKADGTANADMGGGAYYDPETQTGPHSVFISAHPQNLASEWVRGIGMVQGTPGRHPNIMFEATSEEEPPPVIHALTVSTQGTGGGDLGLEPPGGEYPAGTIVTLTARPRAGSIFAGWSGGLSGSDNPITLEMDSDKQVVATFNLEEPPPPGQHTLDMTQSGTGSGQVTLSPPEGPYDAGTVVTLVATPQAGSVFAGWEGDLSGTANPTTISMDSNKQVTAIFDVEGPSPGPDIEEVKRLIRLAQQHLNEALRILEQG